MSTNIENHEYDSNSSLNPLVLASDPIYLAVLNAAIDLNLFEIIGKGSPEGMSPSKIASKLENPYAGMARRLDRMQNFKQVILDEEEDLFKKFHWMPMYEYMEMDPTFKTIFHGRCNGCLSTMMMKYVLETYKGFEGITLVDVGGGIGQSLKMVISKYPSIQALL
ncbi:isoliquiritigenin 2'-O-methyltransferase-like [Neltuma alba]|uniref:isoliquiritigenin 2'-O-methyltransferase-like n=1 Tax=Neltuma alba TaxID=207710 RepID=UPI0010A2E194|nr:isoliquiritigenin 2'-O-methyltransferase-like [Prosopis alba]